MIGEIITPPLESHLVQRKEILFKSHSLIIWSTLTIGRRSQHPLVRWFLVPSPALNHSESTMSWPVRILSTTKRVRTFPLPFAHLFGAIVCFRDAWWMPVIWWLHASGRGQHDRSYSERSKTLRLWTTEPIGKGVILTETGLWIMPSPMRLLLLVSFTLDITTETTLIKHSGTFLIRERASDIGADGTISSQEDVISKRMLQDPMTVPVRWVARNYSDPQGGSIEEFVIDDDGIGIEPA